MAEQSITKCALMKSFTQLMETEQFSKIGIAEICNGCDMNRKSFYYHFKDKQDLIIWMFEYDVSHALTCRSQESFGTYIEKLCACLYEKRNLYKKLLKIDGQNNLFDYIRNRLYTEYGTFFNTETEYARFLSSFKSDAIALAIKRWICENDTQRCEAFVPQLLRAAEIQNKDRL